MPRETVKRWVCSCADRAPQTSSCCPPISELVSIDNFLDGEGIAQEDLVAWVTIEEHLPRTEDLPLISNFGSFFDLVPSNMHSVNAAMDVKAEL